MTAADGDRILNLTSFDLSSLRTVAKQMRSCMQNEDYEKEIDLKIQDGGKIKSQKDIDHHGPKHIPTICHLRDPLTSH
jgi:hypothetical protein